MPGQRTAPTFISTRAPWHSAAMIYEHDHARRFVLQRDEDVTGISGTGIVAEGVIFRDGVGCLRWLTEWPTSVVFYDRGEESVETIHGHGGKTVIVWLDD